MFVTHWITVGMLSIGKINPESISEGSNDETFAA